MKIVKLADHLAVSEQVLPADLPDIAAAGFRVLINNRPDNEVPNQPASDEIAAAADAVGIRYYYVPITAVSFPGTEVDLMATLMHHGDEPTLAFCRTGTRCANLWVATQPEDPAASVAHARSLGFDLAMSGHPNSAS